MKTTRTKNKSFKQRWEVTKRACFTGKKFKENFDNLYRKEVDKQNVREGNSALFANNGK